jgi:steroid delta-isomerase-like uncharacterized protein
LSIPVLVSAFYSRIWNDGDVGAIADLIAEDFSFRGSLGAELRGREAFRDYVLMVRSALVDYRCDILDCVTENHRAFSKMRFSGRHVGTFRGFAPTGKQVEWVGAALFELRGAQIGAVWVLGDVEGLDARLCDNQTSRESMCLL